MTFDTANETERAAGKNVFRGTAAYVKFLPGGIIFAPTLNQSNSIWGDRDRRDVNMTVLDFYIVPKLSDPKTFVTFDPAINSNWDAAILAELYACMGEAASGAHGLCLRLDGPLEGRLDNQGSGSK
jgi:hypothetical protein